MVHDPQRGFLYVTSKLQDDVYVVDVRDDSTSSFEDANVFELETLARTESGSTCGGFRGSILSPSRALLYLTQRSPDALVAIDLERIPDDATLAPIDQLVAGVVPLPTAGLDLGNPTASIFGGAGMALTADERYLLITHFRQNAVSVFDLDRGAIGEEVAWIPYVGENPVEVRVSPDQRYAVVANYVGEVTDNHAESTLAVIDLDPASDTYLEVVTWLVNR
jgi:DNA-binding beta-propeller fold protein YncE